jgi:hypothetical protein
MVTRSLIQRLRMTSSSPRSPSKRAVVSHREVLAQTRAAVAKWAAENSGRRDVVAASILELLANCVRDKNGDRTLEAVSSIFEEHVGLFSPTLAHRLAALADAAHALGRTRTQRVER